MKQRRNTKQRQLVLDAVKARCDHPSADEIYLDLRAANERISRGTVYRNLKVLEHQGAILLVKLPHIDRFEPRLDPHYHLICTGCGRVSDLDLPYRDELDEEAAENTGYRIERHRAYFEGLCPDCSREKGTHE